jgi:hypothetical protein
MRKLLAARLSGPAFVLGIVLMVFLMVFTITSGAAVAEAAPANPHISNAYRLLSRAHYVLRVGSNPTQPHRLAALQDVAGAIEQLRLAVAMNNNTLPPMEESGTPKAPAAEIHHHAWMHDALTQCQEALTEIQAAPPDSGAHRAKAIQQVNAAIAQLQLVVNE